MSADLPSACVLHLMRITIEAATPLSIGSGDSVENTTRAVGKRPKPRDYDSTGIVRDAAGLPTLPGPSIQGVLKSLYEDETAREVARDMFGWALGEDGQAGRLTVGWGAVHDGKNNAVVGLGKRADLAKDGLLKQLLDDSPMQRDHVALNARHVVDGRHKFSRAAVPRGTRFSMEFSLWGAADPDSRAGDRKQLMALARLFRHPALRLGGSSGRGYGRVKLVRASHATPDLADPHALRTLRGQPPSVPLTDDITRDPQVAADFDNAPTTITVTLTPCNPWRVGSGQKAAVSMTEGTYGVRLDGEAARTPIDGMEKREKGKDPQTIVREPCIEWTKEAGTWNAPRDDGPWDFPVPGSAIKGPLAHRALYHFNRVTPGRVVDVDAWLKRSKEDRAAFIAKDLQTLSTRHPDLERLFGAAKDKGDRDEGRGGRLLVNDGRAVDVKAVQAVDHNSIDRFTGGVRDQTGALYAEEVLVGGKLVFDMILLAPLEGERDGDGPGGWNPAAAKAFLAALDDLCQGRLAIGAKSLGFYEGDKRDVVWSGAAAVAWKALWEAKRA